MKRSLKIVLGTVLVAVLGLVGATAMAAREFHGRGEFMKQHATAFIDGALDAARVTADQRATINAARDKVFTTFAANHPQRADFEEAIALFDADKLDANQVAALRAKHEANRKLTGDAIVEALTTAHDTLSPAQRKVVADYVRDHKPSHMGRNRGEHVAGLGGEMMKRFASNRIDAALEAINATPAQKTAIEGARDHVFAAFESLRASGSDGEPAPKMMEQALALFESNQVSASQIASLRAEHEAKADKIGDAIVQALYDVHDTLSPVQRTQLTDYIRAEHGRHRGFEHGAAGPNAGPSSGDSAPSTRD